MYVGAQSITLTCDDGSGSGCSVTYYTTDGGEPTIGSQTYTEPITIATTTTLKYFSKDLAGNSESVKTEIYSITQTAGDIDGNGAVDLADAILALQVMAGNQPSATIFMEADVNNDNRIGLEEAIYIMQRVAGFRQ